MDMFFAAVEQMKRPELKDTAFAIGGLGMISTANYVARKYGVRSAMPGFIGKVLCSKPAPSSALPPVDLLFVQPDFSKYVTVSHQAKELLREFDPFLQSGGIDEAFLDVTDYMHAHGMTGEQVAHEIRARIRQANYTLPDVAEGVGGLTCSCGVAPNRRLAKVCSDINKPDGQFCIGSRRDEMLHFVSSLPIRKIGGIGKVTERMLQEVFGVSNCADLQRARAGISKLLHRGTAEFLLTVALGLGATESHQTLEKAGYERKGISCERTFRSMSSVQELEAKAWQLAQALADDMHSHRLQGKTLTLKLKPVTFDTFTRAVTLPAHTDDKDRIYSAALQLLRKEYPLNIRLMGIRMSNLVQDGSAAMRLPSTQPTLHFFTNQSACAAGGAASGSQVSGEAVELLCTLVGVNPQEATAALERSGGNVERAADSLLSRLDVAAEEPATLPGVAFLAGPATGAQEPAPPPAHQSAHDDDVGALGAGRPLMGGSHVATRGTAAVSTPARRERGAPAGRGRGGSGGGVGGSRSGGMITSFFTRGKSDGGGCESGGMGDGREPVEEVESGVSPGKVERLVEMGFERPRALAALKDAGGRVELAVSKLMSSASSDGMGVFGEGESVHGAKRRVTDDADVSKRRKCGAATPALARPHARRPAAAKPAAGPLDVFLRRS
jgi:nucleotidyltransferase/DNA polymerase involved in DNA repair